MSFQAMGGPECSNMRPFRPGMSSPATPTRSSTGRSGPDNGRRPFDWPPPRRGGRVSRPASMARNGRRPPPGPQSQTETGTSSADRVSAKLSKPTLNTWRGRDKKIAQGGAHDGPPTAWGRAAAWRRINRGEHDGLSVAFAQAHVLAFQNGALFGKALGIGLGAAYRGHEHGRPDAGVGGRRAGGGHGPASSPAGSGFEP